MQPASKKAVIVVGAGASKEFKLPTGIELKSIIAKDLRFDFNDYNNSNNGSQRVHAALSIKAQQDSSFSNYQYTAKQISDSLPLAISIDNYIDSHAGNKTIEYCGKLAIANSIINAEQKSNLYVKSDNINNTINQEKSKTRG